MPERRQDKADAGGIRTIRWLFTGQLAQLSYDGIIVDVVVGTDG
jgi:hypothetical protein